MATEITKSCKSLNLIAIMQPRWMKTYPVALECLYATTSRPSLVSFALPGQVKLPYLDSFIKASADDLLAIGMERNAVNTLIVSIGTTKAVYHVALYVPHMDAVILLTPGCDELAVGGDGNCRNEVTNGEVQNTAARVDVPQTNSVVGATRYYCAAVSRKV